MCILPQLQKKILLLEETKIALAHIRFTELGIGTLNLGIFKSYTGDSDIK